MTTAQSIMLRTMTNIDALAKTYKTKPALFAAVARQSGVSESMVTKMYYGQRTPTIRILDKLTAGVDRLIAKRL